MPIKVQNYIKYLKDNYNDEIVNQFKNLYNQEMSVMNRPLFINGMEDYSTPENIPEYPSWDSIKNRVRQFNKSRFQMNILVIYH